MTKEVLLLILIALPLIGATINGIFGKRMPKMVVGTLATLTVVISFGLAMYLFSHLDKAWGFKFFTVADFDEMDINVGFHFDSLAVWMTLIITGIGSLIHLFSMGYMSHDEGYYKFFTYLNLFIFSMLLLVLGSNYLVLFFGWEGVGICSYLLIGFHYNDPEKGIANSLAARKAFIMNRIGDLGLLFAVFMLMNTFGSLEFLEIGHKLQTTHTEGHGTVIGLITLCLFLAATGKSAQIPLFTWLPDAMAGPTPVSALIHAATMVTAGVYLIIRSNFLFELAPFTKDLILWIGIATTLMAAFIALRQTDIKKVLAYSTVSQLGLMFVALGMGAYTAALFHVTTHAFFKALLFLGSGSVIHALSDEQDIRKMGGLRKLTPITHFTFLIGTLAIAGFPFLSGFYSKDEIIAHAWMHQPVIFGLLIVAVVLTAIYMFRLYLLVFHGKFRGSDETKAHIHESPWNMTLPLIVLAVLSIFGGLLNLPGLFLHDQAQWLSDFLGYTTFGLNAIKAEHLSTNAALILMVGASAIVFVVMYLSYQKNVKKELVFKKETDLAVWEYWSLHKLHIDELYKFAFVNPLLWFTKRVSANVETKVISGGVFGMAQGFLDFGNIIRRLQTGFLSSYLFWMVAGIIGMISYYLLKTTFWN